MTTKISSYSIQTGLLNQIVTSVPKITLVGYVGDDTATSTAGGQTVTITGTGFQAGAVVYVDTTPASPVTVVSSTQITFTAPARATGSYILYVVNPDGGSAIYVPGVQYSGVPNWASTAGSQGSYYETATINNSFVATGDAPISYALQSGSFPPGSSFNGIAGTLTGTAQAETGSTTYTFTIRATDAQNQDTDRTFSLTINTDLVTWATPADGFTSNIYEFATLSNIALSATSAAGSSVAYTANSLPAGITLSGAVISGAPTTVANTVSNITATATTTTRTANIALNFNVLQDVVTWSSPADGTNYSVGQGTSISPVTLSATSAAGFSINYAANTLPTGLTLSSGVISGTPSGLGNTVTQISATAATSNRSATPRIITWTVSVSFDSLWKFNTLLLSANTAVQTASFIADNSVNNAQLTVFGDARAQNFNPYQTGYYSTFFNGTTDYLSAAATSVFAIPTTTTPFTFEGWFYLTSSSVQQYVFSEAYTGTGNSIPIYVGFSNGSTSTPDNVGLFPTIGYYTGSAWAVSAVTSSAITINTWYHVAWVFSGSATYVFVNGVNTTAAGAATTWGGALNNNGDGWYLGRRWDTTGASGSYYQGYMSNFRFVKGTAVYTSNFTPSATPLLPITNTAFLTCQNNKFVDSSINSVALTVNGTPKVQTFVPFTTVYQASTQYYSGSFNGSTDYLSVAANPAFNFGTGNFTIEAWAYPTSSGSYRRIFSQYTGAGATQVFLRQNNDNALMFYVISASSVIATITSSSLLVLNTWNHCAISRNGSAFTLYLNGISVGTASSASSLPDTSALTTYISTYDGTNEPWAGYISNLRVVKGTAVYTGNFVPPTAPLTTTQSAGTNIAAITGTQTSLLTCQSSTFVDNSTNAFTITAATTTVKPSALSPFTPVYYSNYFNGSGDYLVTPSSTAFGFGTGDFTVECWAKTDLASKAGFLQSIFDTRSNGNTTDTKVRFSLDQSNVLAYYVGNSTLITGPALSAGRWYHIALVRISGTSKLYIDGVQTGSSAADTNNFATTDAVIGTVGDARGSYDGYFKGQISNLRVVKGQGLYTTAFTPSTAPLTTTSQGATAANVSLLTCQSPYIGDVSNNLFAITTAGTPKVAAVSPFTQPTGYTTTAVTTWGSGYFDGTGDYLTVSSQAGLSFSTGDFTIECWAFYTVINSDQGIVDCRSTPGTLQSWLLNVRTGGVVDFIYSGAARLQTSGLFSAGSWNHIAVTRASGTIRIFVNGVQGASVSYASAIDSSTTTPNIGRASDPVYTTGYISDLRVIKGTALYTSAFVPQFTTPLSAVTNTQLLTLQTRGNHNNSAFVDNSGANNVITRFGNSTNGTFSPYGNNWSVYFPANGTAYNVAYTAGMNIGTSQFTIEAWVYTLGTLASQQTIYSNRTYNSTGTGTYTFYINATTNTLKLDELQTPTGITTSTGTITPATWTHVAVTRDSSNSIRIFINGVLSNTPVTSTFNFNSGNAHQIGYNADTNNYSLIGYISNVRLVVGTALYTANFTPSTSSLTSVTGTQVLTCQSPRLIDNSLNNSAITISGTPTVQKFSPFSTITVPTYYSGYFPGNTTQYLTMTAPASFALSTGAYTIECWIYRTGTDTAESVIFSTDSSAGAFNFYVSPTGSIGIGKYGTGFIVATASGAITSNAWYHIAVSRDSTSANATRIYVNGTLSVTGTDNQTWATIGTAIVGGFSNLTTYKMFGYISNLRFTKGQSLYTGAFTPATTPLTATAVGSTGAGAAASITGTVLLLTCQSSTYIDNSTSYLLITGGTTTYPLAVSPFTATAGSQVSYSPATFGGSMYFDGTGDYLSMASSAPLIIGQNSATVEFWIYPTSVSGYQRLVTSSVGGFAAGDFIIRFNNGTFIGGEAITNVSSSTLPSINQWNHVAWVGTTGTAQTLYINGRNVGTAGAYNVTVAIQYIGGYYTTGPAEYANGYMSDVRIIKGAALYTANFFPGASPATPTATIGATTYSSVLLLNGTAGGVADTTRTVDLETLGDAKVTPFSPYNDLYYSNYFDGTGDYLSVAYNSAIDVGTGDFTLECWVFKTTSSTDWRIAGGSPGAGFFGEFSSQIGFGISTVEWTAYYAGKPIPSNTWAHVAWSRSSNTMYVFINGVLAGSTSVTGKNYGLNNGSFLIGSENGGSLITGYISNLRLVKGTGLYTTAFTPSTTPLTAVSGTQLLTCQRRTFIDNSTNALAITRTGDVAVRTQNPFQVNTGLSYYFDGTGDYLAMAENTGLWYFGTGDFTIETWIYLGATNASTAYIVARSQHGVGSDWYLGTTSTNQLQFYMLTGGANIVTSTGTLTLNTWNHVAVARSGTTVRLFINGVIDGTLTSFTSALTSSYGPPVIANASNNTGSHLLTGYITDLRITKGSARYTGAFTPPTGPLSTY